MISMRLRLACLILLSVSAAFGAGPPPIQYNIFSTNRIGNTNQFTNSASQVAIKIGATLTNTVRYYEVTNREPYWATQVGTVLPRRIWSDPSARLIDLRVDPHPNKGIYIGDEGVHDFISLRARGYADQTNSTPYDARITVQFGVQEFREWAWDDFKYTYKVGEGGSKYDVFHFTIDASSVTNMNNFVTNYILGREIIMLTNVTFPSGNGVYGLTPDSSGGKTVLIKTENDGSGGDNIRIGGSGLAGALFSDSPGFIDAGWYEQNTNSRSAWPQNPNTRGAFAIVNSNGTPYLILSGANSPNFVSTNLLIGGGGSGSATNGVLDMNAQTGLTGGAAKDAAVAGFVSQLGFSHFGSPNYTWYPFTSTGTGAGNWSPNVSFDFALPANFGTSSNSLYNGSGAQWQFDVNASLANQTNRDDAHNADGNIMTHNFNLWKYAQVGAMAVNTNGLGVPFYDNSTWVAFGSGNRFAEDGFAGVSFLVTGSVGNPLAWCSTTGDWGSKGSVSGHLNQQVGVTDFANGKTYFMHPVQDVASFTNTASLKAVTVDHFNDILTVRSNVQSMTSIATNWLWVGKADAAGINHPGGIPSEFSSNITAIVYGCGLALDGSGQPYNFFGLDASSSGKLRLGMAKQGANYPVIAAASGAPLTLAHGSTDNLMNSNSTFTADITIASNGKVTFASGSGTGTRNAVFLPTGELAIGAPTNSGGSTATFDPNQFGGPAGGTNIISGALLTNITVRPAANNGNGLTVKGVTSQVGDLITMQDVNGNTVSSLFANGGAGFNGHAVIDNSNGVAVVALAVSNSSTVATAPLAQFTGTNGGVFQIQAGSDVASVAITNSGNIQSASGSITGAGVPNTTAAFRVTSTNNGTTIPDIEVTNTVGHTAIALSTSVFAKAGGIIINGTGFGIYFGNASAPSWSFTTTAIEPTSASQTMGTPNNRWNLFEVLNSVTNSSAAGGSAVGFGAAGTGTDGAGSPIVINSGVGTGTGRGGAIRMQTAGSATSTGSTANGLTERVYISAKRVNLTESSATLVFNISLASGKHCGLHVFATTHADDGTDFQSTVDEFLVSAVNKGGTVRLGHLLLAHLQQLPPLHL